MSIIVPSGTKLVTYDPDHPEWATNTPAEDSALHRNYCGLLIEKGAKTATKQLIAVWGADDIQEQAASRFVFHLVRELTSGSTLSLRLLNRFSFLVVPFKAQQGVRDGFSRFQYDHALPGDDVEPDTNLSANGGSEIGNAVVQQAIDNWLSDHPIPAEGLWGDLAFHGDNLNQFLLTKIPSPTYGTADIGVPVSPYCYASLPGYEVPLEALAAFLGDETTGYRSAAWPEFLKAGQIVAGGTSGNELPWRHAGNKASFFSREDGLRQTVIAYLTGLAVVANAMEEYDGPVDVTGIGSVTVQGERVGLSYSGLISGTASATVEGYRDGRGETASIVRGSVTVQGTRTSQGPASVSGRGSVTVQGRREVSGQVEITGTASVTVSGTAEEVKTGPVDVTGHASVTVQGRRNGQGATNSSARASVNAQGRRDGQGATSSTARASVTVQGSRVPVTAGAVEMVGRASISVRGYREAFGAIEIRGRGVCDVAAGPRSPAPTLTLGTVAPRFALAICSPDLRVGLVSLSIRIQMRKEDDT